MSRSRIARLPYGAFFVVFGCYGGLWLNIGLATSLVPLGAIIFGVFSVAIAPLASFACVGWLWRRRDFSRYHSMAFWGAMSYPGIIVALLFIGSAFFGIDRAGDF